MPGTFAVHSLPRVLAFAAGVAVLTAGCAFDGDGAPPTAISIAPDDAITVQIGDRVALSVLVHHDDGTVEPAHNDDVVWLVDDANVAELDDDGEVEGRAMGDARIEAFHAGMTASIGVTVFDTPKEIHVRADDGHLATGLSMQYAAELEYEHGSREDVTDQVAWASSQISVAEIADTGLVQAVAPGRVQILAVGFDLTGARDLEVEPAIATEVSANPATATLTVGETVQLSAVGMFSDGNVVDITTSARWTSSLSAVARVHRGEVTARAPGDVSVSVGDDHAFAVVQVTVLPAPPPADP